MKTLITILVAIATFTASARSIVIQASPNITRNAGQTVPLTFVAEGFAAGPRPIEIRLVNAKTWASEVIVQATLVNGVNKLQVEIPWSLEVPGPYVLKIVAGVTAVSDKRIITIRSAVIWPYAGTVFPANGTASVSWFVGDWYLGDYMDIALHDEDTNQTYEIDVINPDWGRFEFGLPYGLTGNHFRILLDGFFILESQTLPDDLESGQSYVGYVESTESALIAIR